MSRVFIDRQDEATLPRVMRSALDYIGWETIVPRDARVFIKPNFTYPHFKPGVTTSPVFLNALVEALLERTQRITIGESDGGSHAWTADQAFEGHGLPEMAARHGIQLLNLSRADRERTSAPVAGKQVPVELPVPLLHETDVFITVPVPKVHVMTYVSLGFKNQWGCLPDVKRLRYHHRFPETVLAVHKLLRPKMVVFDGTYFLDRTGPMDGETVKMDLLLASDDVGAGSLACCAVMQIDPRRSPQLALARAEGLMPETLQHVTLNQPLEQFRRRRFELRRTWLHWLTLRAFRSELATHLIYDSKLAKPAHDLLYLIRGRPRDIVPQW